MQRVEPWHHRLHRIWTQTRWKWHGLQVYALVGKSGTGKSFRSALVADKYGIEAILDDGLLIAGGKRMAGRSAKQETHFFAAAKTALLVDTEHRDEIRGALKKARFHRILLLGTSERMVAKVCQTLELPPVTKLIRIEEIATREEIETAIRERTKRGRHVIPLPVVEVNRSYPRLVVESLTVWLEAGWRRMGRRQAVEKSIVRPKFAEKGGVSVSEAAISQMIQHCLSEQSPEVKARKVRIARRSVGYIIKVQLAVPPRFEISPNLSALHDFIIREIESFSGIVIARLSLDVVALEDSDCAPADRRTPR
jgi:hypothetical protein